MDKLFYDISKAFGVDREISEVKVVVKEALEKTQFDKYEDKAGNLIVRVGSGGEKLMVSIVMSRGGYITLKSDLEECREIEVIGTNLEPKLDGKYLKAKGGAVARIHDGNKIDILDGKIQVGEFLTLDEEVRVFQDKICGVEVGNVSLIYSLIKVIENVKVTDKEVFFVFSYKEEGITKSKFAAKEIKPDRAIFFDNSQDGKELQLIYMSRGYLANESFKQDIIRISKENNIDLVLKDSKDENEADIIHKEVGGIPTIILSLPCKYKSTSLQIIDKVLIEKMKKLLIKIVEG